MENSARHNRQRAVEILSIVFSLCKMTKNPNPKVEVFRQKEREGEWKLVGWG